MGHAGDAMKILVAVPVFNEEKYVGPVLREIRKYSRAAGLAQGAELRVLVVNDGSTDGTAMALSDLARLGHIDLLTHPENRGYGQSLIDAFGYAARHQYDWVITLDCDEQHEPCRIPLFVRECLRNNQPGMDEAADIISGSRYLHPDPEGSPPADRRNINRLITELLNATLHLKVVEAPGVRGRFAEAARPGLTDSFCGFKAHRVAAMERMNLTIPGYAFPMQFWVQADALGLVVREIPVKLIYKDATRHFGGLLDDPAARLQHYLEVLTGELKQVREATARGIECGAFFE